MLYLVSVLVNKEQYLYALANKSRKQALSNLFTHSLFCYYDSEKHFISAPTGLKQLHQICTSDYGKDNCTFKVVARQMSDNDNMYSLDTDYDLAYIPAYCITSNARITKYRYIVIAKVCDETDTVKYVRLYDTVTRREMQLSVDKVYAMHTSDLGGKVDVIANMRISKTTNGYKVSAINGNIPIVRVTKDDLNVQGSKPVQSKQNSKYKIDYINEGKTVLTGLNLNYPWENESTFEIPNVTYVAMNKVIRSDAYKAALKNIKLVKIPASVQQMDYDFLHVMGALKSIQSVSPNYIYVERTHTLVNVPEQRICWIAPNYNTKRYTVATDTTVSSYAFWATDMTEVDLEKSVKIERAAFVGSNITKLYIGADVKLCPGCLRGLEQLKSIEIKEELSEDFIVNLLDMNQWLGLEDYDTKTKQFNGKTPRSVKFVGNNAPKTVAMINSMLLNKQQ